MRTAFSVFGPVMGASAIVGPILAGFIISANIGGLTWRPIFLINIVLGAIGFIVALRVLPADEPTDSVFIDSVGAGLLGASMLGLIYGLIEGSTDGWTALPIGCLAAGAALLAAFGVRQRRAADPLILPSLLANRGFTVGMVLGLAFFAAVNGLAYVISLFFQTGLGMTARAASIALSPFMIGIIIASFVCRPLLAKLGRTMVAIGIGLTLAGAAGVWATVLNQGVHVNLWALAPSIFVLGVGAGACFSSLFDVAIGDVAPAEAGSASGSLSAVQQLASAIGSAVVTRRGKPGDPLRISLLRPGAQRQRVRTPILLLAQTVADAHYRRQILIDRILNGLQRVGTIDIKNGCIAGHCSRPLHVQIRLAQIILADARIL